MLDFAPCHDHSDPRQHPPPPLTSGHLSTTTTSHHGSTLWHTQSPNNNNSPTHIQSRRIHLHACSPNPPRSSYPTPNHQSGTQFQPHQRLCPRMELRYGHPSRLPRLEVSRPLQQQHQHDPRSTTWPNLPVYMNATK